MRNDHFKVKEMEKSYQTLRQARERGGKRNAPLGRNVLLRSITDDKREKTPLLFHLPVTMGLCTHPQPCAWRYKHPAQHRHFSRLT